METVLEETGREVRVLDAAWVAERRTRHEARIDAFTAPTWPGAPSG